jgi:hypothetical protein
MNPTLGQPLRGKRPKVRDVIGYYCAPLRAGDLQDGPIAATDEIVAVCDGEHIMARLPQQCRDLRRQLLIE